MSIEIKCDVCETVIKDESHSESVIKLTMDGWGPGINRECHSIFCPRGREAADRSEYEHTETIGHLCPGCVAVYVKAKQAAFIGIVEIAKAVKASIAVARKDSKQ